MKYSKDGVRKNRQADYLVYGFRLFDKVKHDGKEYFIFARRKTGSFETKSLSGEKINKSGSIDYKKLKFLETKHNIITEVRALY